MDIFSERPEPARPRNLWPLWIIAAVLTAAAGAVVFDFFFGSKKGRHFPGEALTVEARPARAQDIDQLRRLLGGIYVSAAAENTGQVIRDVSELMLPDPAGWFPRLFGEEDGSLLAAGYAGDATTMRAYLRDTFRELAERENREFSVVRLTPDNLAENRAGTDAVAVALENSLPLYRVRMSNRPRVMSSRFGFFARDGKTFRYLGMLDVRTRTVEMTREELEKTRDESVSFPRSARRKGGAGFLQFDVVIDRDGIVDSVELAGGDPAVAGYAERAIRKWRYRPVKALGESVKIITRVTIGYRFN